MHWTPLSGAKSESVFGPSGAPARKRSRGRRGRATCRLAVESLESRLTPAITANIVASSLASLTPPNVTIGEIVRMRVVVPEDLSGNFDPTKFNVVGTLPAGLQYLGNADMALVSQNSITSTLDPSGTGGLSVTGQNVNNVTPSFVIPSTAVSINSTTGVLTFNTGIAHANDNGTTTDDIVVEFNALVTNVAGNQAAPSTALTSTFMVYIGGTTCGCKGTDTLNVVEPSITDLTKSAQVSTDGNTATYTLTFSNTGAATAYDVQVLDNLPSGLTLNTGSVQVTGGTGLANGSTAAGLNLTFASIAPAETVTITYSAAIAAADKTGQPITNTANVTYTSLPGPNGTTPNPTGSVTPGASGSSTGERNGSGGVNDYSDTAWATINVKRPSVQPDSLAGFVFADLNHSGDFDAGDLLLPDAVITLEDANGNLVTDLNGNTVQPETTGNNGAFSFIDLKDGTYQLVETYDAAAHGYMDGNVFPGLLNGVQDTTAQKDIAGRRIFDIVLSGGVAGTQYRFGECPCPPVSAMISGFVYLDSNKDCIKETGEPGLSGATMVLTDLNGNPVTNLNGVVVAPVVTDTNGFYTFTDLPAGSYEVTELPPQPIFMGQQTIMECNAAGTVNGVTVGVAPVGSDVITDITLAANDKSINNDFGKVLPSNVGAILLSGNVYFDSNKDCLLDKGDFGVSGVNVILFQINVGGGLTEVAETSTNNLGQYLFEIANPGMYEVMEQQPNGYIEECAQAGTVNGTPRGTVIGVNTITNVTLVDGDNGINYNFALITTAPVSKQQLLANVPTNVGMPPAQWPTSPSYANIDRTAMTPNIVAVGAGVGGGPEVKVYNFTTGKEILDFFAYNPQFTGGVHVAVAYINGTPDIITAPGVGGGPDVKIFNGLTGALISSFWAFSPTFTGGVNLAVGDVNGDGTPDIIVGAGVGHEPVVKVFDGKTDNVIADFYAFYEQFLGGVNVAAGDFNHDGKADIVAGAGPGAIPQVKIFDSATLGAVNPSLLANFYAFNPSYRGGVTVAANSFGQGDVTGDGNTDLVCGTASGVGQVHVFDGTTLALVSSFTAYDSSMTSGGVHVAVFDLNGDGKADVVAGSGGGEGAFVRVVNVATDQDLDFWQAFNPAFLGGAWVAAA